MQGEKLAEDEEGAKNYQDEFSWFKQQFNFKLENIYNADETGINWCSLPRKTLASGTEKSCAGGKVRKDRTTALVCANAFGSHALPLLIIGKYSKPRPLKNLAVLPVIYKCQNSAWMDKDIFMDWFKNHFIPSVYTRQEEDGKTEKILLLLDNAPSHPNIEALNSIDANVEVQYLPKNTTPLIQPMDQGIIE